MQSFWEKNNQKFQPKNTAKTVSVLAKLKRLKTNINYRGKPTATSNENSQSSVSQNSWSMTSSSLLLKISKDPWRVSMCL